MSPCRGIRGDASVRRGLAVGPATPGLVVDREEVLGLADVGVALLMFSIGLQFSIGELRQVGARILLGTPLAVAFTMAIGTGAGLALGWELIERYHSPGSQVPEAPRLATLHEIERMA